MDSVWSNNAHITFRQVKMLTSGPEEGSMHPLNLLSVISSMKHNDSIFFNCCSRRTQASNNFSVGRGCTVVMKHCLLTWSVNLLSVSSATTVVAIASCIIERLTFSFGTAKSLSTLSPRCKNGQSLHFVCADVMDDLPTPVECERKIWQEAGLDEAPLNVVLKLHIYLCCRKLTWSHKQCIPYLSYLESSHHTHQSYKRPFKNSIGKEFVNI